MERNVEPLRTNKRHRDILDNPQPGTRQTLRGQRDFTRERSRVRSTRFHSVETKGLTSRSRLYHRRGNGVSLFLGWEGRKGRNVTIGSERSPSRGEEIRSSTIRVVYAGHYFVYISLSCPEKTPI